MSIRCQLNFWYKEKKINTDTLNNKTIKKNFARKTYILYKITNYSIVEVFNVSPFNTL